MWEHPQVGTTTDDILMLKKRTEEICASKVTYNWNFHAKCDFKTIMRILYILQYCCVVTQYSINKNEKTYLVTLSHITSKSNDTTIPVILRSWPVRTMHYVSEVQTTFELKNYYYNDFWIEKKLTNGHIQMKYSGYSSWENTIPLKCI